MANKMKKKIPTRPMMKRSDMMMPDMMGGPMPMKPKGKAKRKGGK